MKTYAVRVRYQQAPPEYALQELTIEASSWAAAARLAVERTLTYPQIKGRRHQSIELMLTLTGDNANAITDPD